MLTTMGPPVRVQVPPVNHYHHHHHHENESESLSHCFKPFSTSYLPLSCLLLQEDHLLMPLKEMF